MAIQRLYSILDNSGFVPTIVSVPALTEKMKFKIGVTEIKIGSTDLTGNTKKCSFFVTVIGRYQLNLFKPNYCFMLKQMSISKYEYDLYFSDDEPPIIDFCRSPPIFLVDDPEDISKGKI